jgi:hypothetical protein
MGSVVSAVEKISGAFKIRFVGVMRSKFLWLLHEAAP